MVGSSSIDAIAPGEYRPLILIALPDCERIPDATGDTGSTGNGSDTVGDLRGDIIGNPRGDDSDLSVLPLDEDRLGVLFSPPICFSLGFSGTRDMGVSAVSATSVTADDSNTAPRSPIRR